MKTMVISEFKSKCIATVKRVKRDQEPVLLTIRGEPYATVQPVQGPTPPRVLGGQQGAMRIAEDIVNVSFADDWEVVTDPGKILRPAEESP